MMKQDHQKDLRKLRKQIDTLDEKLIKLLAERFEITHQIGHLKAQTGEKPKDTKREQSKIEQAKKIAAELGITPKFTIRVLKLIMDEVVENHKQTAKKKSHK
jgi:chorismate mutase